MEPRAMPIALRPLIALGMALSLPGCSGFNLDPGPGPAVAKADSSLTAPPPELRNGTAR